MLLAPSLKIFNASAGSGKTYEITFNYIHDIMDSVNWSDTESSVRFYNILAITFTNKAAAEMKSRVLKELFLLSTGYSGMLGRLCNELSIEESEVSSRASSILSGVLHNYSRFSISTIDSFMQKIIRFFARELKMQSDYEVIIEEADLNKFIIENLLLKVCSGGELEQYMLSYALSLFENENKPEKIKEELVRHLDVLVRECPSQITEALLNLDKEQISAFARRVRFDIENLSDETKSLAEQIHSEISVAGLEEKIYRGQYLGKFIDKLATDSFVTPNVSESKMLGTGQLFVNASVRQEEYFRTRLQTMVGINRQISGLKLISSNIYSVGLSNVMWREKSLFMDIENVLPVSEFNEKISEVVRGEAVPFIYLRAGEKYSEIMIDEFQDTSVKQWHNLVPLLHETLSKHGKVYLVGDPKQSIYRWRSGQPEIMMQLPAIYQKSAGKYQEAEKTFKNALKETSPMNINYRSDKNIVEFNNAFFEFVKTTFEKFRQMEVDSNPVSRSIALKYNMIYRHFIQESRAKEEGYLEFRFIDDSGKPDFESDTGITFGTLQELHKVIDEAVSRGYFQREIAVIARDKKTLNEVARYLMLQTTYNVMSKETLQLDFSPRCRLAVNIFNYFTSPTDPFARYELVYILQQQNWLNSGLNPEDIQSEIVRTLHTELEISSMQFERYASMNLAMEYIFERLLRRFPHDVFLLFFREEVINFIRKNGFSPAGFRHWWSEKGHAANVVFPDGAEAISLMTIHKSKGLQFPVVILPNFDFCEESKIFRNSKWVMLNHGLEAETEFPVLIPLGKKLLNSEFAETFVTEKTDAAMDTLNLMYVAQTRAEHEMYVLAKNYDRRKMEKDFEGIMAENLSASKMLRLFCESAVFFSDVALERSAKDSDGQFSLYCKGRKTRRTKTDMSEQESFTLKLKKHYISLPESEKSATQGKALLHSKEKILVGKLIHALLEEISTIEDIEPALQRFEGRNFNAVSKEIIEKMIREAVAGAGNLFNPRAKVWTERELCDENGDILRPDRMVKYEDLVTIADFKTGKVSEEHKSQVENYRRIVESVGFKVGAVMIIYFHFDEERVEIVVL